jgi:stage III sporulation protein AD
LRACGIGIITAICIVVVGRLSGEYVAALRIGGALILFGLFLFLLDGAIDSMGEMLLGGEYGDKIKDTLSTMLKALGIGLVCRFCEDICRDCGEGTLAGAVESVGRIAIFALSVPIMLEIIGVAEQMLQMIE